VTIAKRPYVWDGIPRDIDLIWVKREAEYFRKQHWTGQIELIPQENFSSVIPGRRQRVGPMVG
jgi:hypothetical protein